MWKRPAAHSSDLLHAVSLITSASQVCSLKRGFWLYLGRYFKRNLKTTLILLSFKVNLTFIVKGMRTDLSDFLVESIHQFSALCDWKCFRSLSNHALLVAWQPREISAFGSLKTLQWSTWEKSTAFRAVMLAVSHMPSHSLSL